jgi:Flavin containing amine oxidoreductase
VLFLADLHKVYPGANAFLMRGPGGGVLPVHLENWSRNPLFRGSYTCNQPGYFTTIAGNEAPPVGNLFFAGEHTNSAKAARQPGLIGGGAEGGPLQRDVASGHHAGSTSDEPATASPTRRSGHFRRSASRSRRWRY